MRPVSAIFVLLLICAPVHLVWGGDAPAGAIGVGDEVVIMADGPGKSRRGAPAVAFGKDGCIVVWREGWQGERGSSRIHAVRVGLDGKVLSARGIEIAPCQTGVQENPRVAFFPSTGSGQAGGVFLVVWQDMRNGKDCDVLGARVSPEGSVLDAQPLAIATGPRTQTMPDVAADDKGFMVVWHAFQGEETTPKVFATRVGADGTVAQPSTLADGSSPRIAWNGEAHLVTWFDARMSGDRLMASIRFLRMDAAGKRLPSPPGREPSFPYRHSRQVSICGVPGKGWVLVCARTLPDFWGWSGPGAQRLFSITPEGKLAADSPSEQYYDAKTRKTTVPANWLDSSIDKKGVRPWGGSALAADGQRCIAVWQRYHTGGPTGIELVNGDILASRVDGWKPLDKDGVVVTASAANERNPALAGNGDGKLLCAYERVEDGRTGIVVRTLQTQ